MDHPTPGFEPARAAGAQRHGLTAGTAETTWREALQDVPEWMPHSRTLAVVAPHPDDATLGAGGLIQTCAELGYEITIILVTDGDARPAIGQRRCGELRSALMRLAPDGARVTRLCFTYDKIAPFQGELLEALVKTVPHDCTLVAPYENDGHSDHIATSHASQMAALALGVPCVRYPIWAWYGSTPQELRTHPLRRVTLAEPARLAKQQALACHESQIESRGSGAIVRLNALPYFERPYEVFIL